MVLLEKLPECLTRQNSLTTPSCEAFLFFVVYVFLKQTSLLSVICLPSTKLLLSPLLSVTGEPYSFPALPLRALSSPQDADPQQVHVEVACVQPPPSNGETPKVKTECEDQSSPLPSEAAATSKTSRLSCKKGMSLGGTPRPARRTIWERNTPRTPDRASARQAGAEGREDTDGGWGGGIGSDPLAPYDRIEEETVDDSGLKELLHTGRRDGYLDLRRYRKPGWPRPLRVTRVEASHGKRCVCWDVRSTL